MSKSPRWRKKETEDLIFFLKTKPVIWDKSHEYYRNSKKREKALKEISKSLGIDRQRVTKKVENMIDNYYKVLSNVSGMRHWIFDLLDQFLKTDNYVSRVPPNECNGWAPIKAQRPCL
ncbi:transcription factor Adf-1-like [Euwallacea similis]|uniref:transcription factor Adf-1-like n=1 Tax=Euwallacea similis TaxID=1736056 RepID=UPI00344C51D3